MPALTDRLDHFVRWFFNSSPTSLVIEPIEPRRAQREEVADLHQAVKASRPGTRPRVRP